MCLSSVSLLSSDSYQIQFYAVLCYHFTRIGGSKMAVVRVRVLLVLSIVVGVSRAQFCDIPEKFPDYDVSYSDKRSIYQLVICFFLK